MVAFTRPRTARAPGVARGTPRRHDHGPRRGQPVF
jgi:hypothetical protein